MSDPNAYTVGWICAISTEYVAARQFLDVEHDPPGFTAANDSNSYTLGTIGKHYVVIAVLPAGEYGIVSAASVAKDMLHSFPNVRVGLMVGIGGGAPSPKHDIRLGDVVVSTPRNGMGGVFQYDFGKTVQGQKFVTTGYLNQPPTVVRTAVADLRARYEADGHQIPETIDKILTNKRKLKKNYGRPDQDSDRLYKANVVHPKDAEDACANVCSSDSADLISREERDEDDDDPAIHYGLIASANQLMEDAELRDQLAKERDVLCFEMEAAGLMNNFPCLVIRGVCDYSDTHRNKVWQGYAAMAAAAYAKDLLRRIHPNKIEAEKRLGDLVSDLKNTADEHREISRQHLKIAQDAAKENMSERQKECLHLFRLTERNKNATYESYKNRVEDRVEGTCRWVLEHDNFCTWTKQDFGPLVISADPGCGKSVLAKFLVNSVLPRTSTVCYFFFKEPDQITVCQALCALLHQLFCQKPTLIEHAMEQFGKNGKSLINLRESLWEILADALIDPQAGPIIIVIDALDECVGSELNDLLQNVEKQCRRAQAKSVKLKFLLTTRPYDQILSRFRYLFDDASSIRIPGEDESERISYEVNLVIKYRVGQLAKEKTWTDDIKTALSAQLLDIPHRTYLWVYLIFDFLRSETIKKTGKGVTSAIQTLPKDVNAAYENILSKSTGQTIVRKVLAIILAAERPLSLAEMNVAVNVGPKTQRLDDIDLEPEEDFMISLRSWCGLFVSIYEGNIYFLHQTAREFLLADTSMSAAATPDLYWQHSINLCQASKVLLEVCMRYLILFKDNLDLLRKMNRWASVTTRSMALVFYAIDYWPSHFRTAQIVETDVDTLNLALQLSDPLSELYRAWISGRHAEVGSDTVESLGVAIYFGLQVVAEYQLVNGPDMMKKGNRIVTFAGLQWAVHRNDLEMVKLLLNNGADVNAQGQGFISAFEEAAHEGYNDILELLLAYGADINTCVRHFGTALGAAASRGEQNVVKMLIIAGADIGQQGGQYGCALGAAVHGGIPAITIMLLEAGADVNQPCAEYSSALGVAAVFGDTRIVEILLNRGATTSSMDQYRETPLHLASRCGNLDTIQTLLAHNACPNTANAKGQTPLHIACDVEPFRILPQQDARIKAVQLLLQHGAKVNIPARDGCTPLMHASEAGYPDIVSALLANAAEVSITDRNGRTALSYASVNNHLEVVTKLLEKGADFAPDERGWTPLLLASRHGHLDVVDSLLDWGADLAEATAYNGNALHHATQGGHLTVVKLLLNKGADIATASNHGYNPLHVATQEGHLEVVKLLLDEGAESSGTDDYGWTPLHIATQEGHLEVVKLLLDEGADISVTTHDGLSPLHLAAMHESIEQPLNSVHAGLTKFPLDESLQSRGAEIGWNPEVCSNSNYPHMAAKRKYVNIMTLLLNNGADWSATGSRKWAPLHVAARYSSLELVTLVAKKGARMIHATTIDGLTSLHLAAFQGDLDVVEFLSERSANVLNARDDAGCTPIHLAAVNGHIEVVKLLIAEGADLSIANSFQHTPLRLALEANHFEVARVFLEEEFSRAPNGLGLVDAMIANLLALKGLKHLLRFCVENNPASLHVSDDHNRTPLQLAARSGCLDTYLYVASTNLDLTAVDAKGDDLVCFAASSGCLDILNIVLQGHTQPDNQKKGWGPLHWACRTGSLEVVEALLVGGWNSKKSVIVPEMQGEWTPFAVAAFHRNKDMFDTLSESTQFALSTELDVFYPKGDRHGGYICDGCFNEIYGPRFQCNTCANLDYCFMCKFLLDHLHEGHGWDRLEPPMDDGPESPLDYLNDWIETFGL